MERVQTFSKVAGTDYGYIKPVKPAKVAYNTKSAYIAKPNVADGEYIPGYDEKNTINGKIKQYIEDLRKNNKTTPVQTNLNNYSKPQEKQKNDIQTRLQQQADNEFMQKMNIHNMSEITKDNSPQEELTEEMDYFDYDEE